MNIKSIIFLYFVFIPIVLFSQNNSSTYSLEEIINIALNNSPQFETNKLELQAAEENYKVNTSFIYPKLNLNFNMPVNINKSEQEVFDSGLDRYQWISRWDRRLGPRLSLNSQQHLFNDAKIILNLSGLNSRQESDLLDERNRFSGSAYISYDQRLFSINNFTVDKQEAEMQLKLARIKYNSHKNDFIERIVEKYYELLIKLKNNEINLLSLINKKFQHSYTIELYKSGRKTELDTLESSINLKDAEINILRNKEDLENNKADLVRLAGLNFDKIFNIDEKIDFIPFALNQSDAVEMCLTNHPQIQTDKITIKQDQLALTKLKSSLGMSLDFSTSFYYQDNRDYQPRKTTNQYYNWDIGLSFSMPLFDGGKSSAEIQKSTINSKKQNLLLLEQNEELKKEIVDLYHQFSIKQKEIEILKDKHRASTRALELANEKFKNGNLGLKELTEYESGYYKTELDQLQTFIDYNKIVYQLKKYAGMELLP